MKLHTQNRKMQRGVMLIEALVSVLIFSIGILALVGLQATSINLSSDAKYRADASLLANQLIGNMWNDAATAVANSAAGATFSLTEFDPYKGPTGTNFTSWLNNAKTVLPQATAVVTTTTTISPTVALAGVVQTTSTDVTVSISWTPPSATTSHTYVTNTTISGSKQIN